MGAWGKEQAARKCFKHAHAPNRLKRPPRPGEKQTVAVPARSPDAASRRERSVREGKFHGNYPFVGQARTPLGRTTEMGVGSGVIIDGIGPSNLNIAGIGGIETIPLVDRCGGALFVTTRTDKPKRVYDINQVTRPRSSELAKFAKVPERQAYTRFCIHNFSATDLIAMRETRPSLLGPGQYTVAPLQVGFGGRFAPQMATDGKRCKLGRSSDMDALPPRPRQEKLHITREHGPYFCKATARRARRRPQTAHEVHSKASGEGSWIASASLPVQSPRAADGRPILKTFLHRFHNAKYASEGHGGRGGPSFRMYHTVPVDRTQRKVIRNMWQHTSMADYTHQRLKIVWDREKRQNVTIHLDLNESSNSQISNGRARKRNGGSSSAASVASGRDTTQPSPFLTRLHGSPFSSHAAGLEGGGGDWFDRSEVEFEKGRADALLFGDDFRRRAGGGGRDWGGGEGESTERAAMDQMEEVSDEEEGKVREDSYGHNGEEDDLSLEVMRIMQRAAEFQDSLSGSFSGHCTDYDTTISSRRSQTPDLGHMSLRSRTPNPNDSIRDIEEEDSDENFETIDDDAFQS